MYLLDDQGMFHTMRELLEFYYHHPVNNTEPLKKPVITMPERRPTVPLKQNILYGGSTPASQPVGHAGAMAGSIGTPQPPTFPRAASMAARPQLPQHRPQQPPQQPAEAMYESVDDFDVMPPKPEAKTTITYDDLPPARSGGAPVVSAASHRGSNSAPVYEDLESAHRPTFSPMNRPNKAVSSAGYVMMSAPATLPTAGPLAGPPSSFSSPAAAATPPPRPSSKSKPWKAGSRASMGGSFATAPNDVDLEALIRRLTADMGGGDDY